MSIESTQHVKKEDALDFLSRKGIIVPSNIDCEILGDLMYLFRQSIFENYWVYEKEEEHIVDNHEFSREWWHLPYEITSINERAE